ncbi:MAG: DUF87 domain-containing protein [Nitrospiraceae bacterium]|nr:DUF87 domain-containing protein [Nitrospiraceae bacterium]
MSKVYIGINKSNPRETVEWNTEELVNGHWIIVGGTGSGKTHRIVDITRQLQTQNMRIHVFDAHGDIRTDPEFTSRVEFSEISPYGINPLSINPSPIYGGVRKRINSLIRLINKYSDKFEDRQEAVMRYALNDLYSLHGFDSKNPETWALDSTKMPTLEDLRRFIYEKIKGFMLGHMCEISDTFERLNRGLLDIRRLHRYDVPWKIEMRAGERHEQMIGSLREELKAVFGRLVDTVEADDFEQFIHYDGKEVLKALYDRIEKMRAMGVFKTVPPPFDPDKPIWLYAMDSLCVEEQGYLVELTIEELFSGAVQRGFRSEVDTLVFIDEAQRFISSDDRDHIISVIFREIRKFGGGLVLATQNCETFPTDVIVNSGTKMILGVDEGYHDILSKKLGVERIRFIQPRKNALVQINTKTTSLGSRFVDTLFSLPGETS